ncbi:MAG: sulfatase-like hydrolase/transferase [Proteobacteria bacterium]|nr:sulfatase-like hydrolase/transferase [Pseudomonadota bacterium]
MVMTRGLHLSLILLCCSAGCSHSGNDSSANSEPDNRPNILLLVADDLGYADLGIYGSDIETPNIDALAAQGMLFTQFHTAPSCAPTRAMLLSGNNNHVAGMARQGQIGLLDFAIRGYESSLSDRIVPFPRLLQDAGYHTYTVGKWHLGLELETSPHSAGFDRAFNLLDGAGTHFDAVGFFAGGSTYRQDADLVEYPVGRYSTDLYTDRLIEFIDANKDDGIPFFAFVAYTSPHWPLQVPDEYLDLYAGNYDDGYDALRERRFESLQEAGIIPLSSQLPPRNDAITPWEDLTSDEHRRESRKMELYAAMVDNLDDHVGRLLDYLKSNHLYDNTLIVFMSDNGAAGEDFYNRGDYSEYVQANFDNAYEKMGTAESFVSYDEEWAEAGSAPFQRHKGYTREGGIVAPMIIAGPGVVARGVIDSTYLTVMDLAPTFLEIAGAKYPDDGSVRPMLGESITKFLEGHADIVHADDYVTTLYHAGRAYLRQGTWKISNLERPFDEADFELFDLSTDPGEAVNLADDEPEKLAELIELWREERKSLGIILPQDL